MTLIGTQAFYDRSLTDMASLRSRAGSVQQSLGTGQKLARSSDDPVAASRLRQLSRSEALSDIDVKNANAAEADLILADEAMSSMSSFILRAGELATQAASAGLAPSQRVAIGKELSEIQSALLDLANSRDSSGHALFGGQLIGNAYAMGPSGQAIYTGTEAKSPVPIGLGLTVEPGLTGPDFIGSGQGSGTDLFATLSTLATSLQSGAASAADVARTSLTGLRAGLDALTTGQTIIGSRLSWIDVTNELRISQSERVASEQAELGGTDIAEAVTRLQQITTALEASQAGFARLSKLSLFDVIR